MDSPVDARSYGGSRADAGDVPSEAGRRVASAAALLFLLYGALTVIGLAKLMPPFQNADEVTSFMRADQVSRGGLIAVMAGENAGGGRVEANIVRAADPLAALKFHAERRVDDVALQAAMAVGWSAPEMQSFANTAMYPPVFYLPAATAVAVGRELGLSIVHTLKLARVVSGLVCVALGAAAIAVAGAAAPWMFVVLCLPMSLSQMAAVSHDGPAIGCAAVAAGLLTASMQGERRLGLRGVLACAAALVLVVTDRPPYAPLVLILLAVPGLRMVVRVLAVAGVLAASLAWVWVAAPFIAAFARGDVDPGAQLQGLLAAPWRIVPIAARTLAEHAGEYVESFIGRLGWLDTPLPPLLHDAAWVALGVGLLVCLPGRRVRVGRGNWLAAGAIAVACAAVFLTQYLTWTPVGRDWVEGIQGRYFIPIALFLPCVLPPFGPDGYGLDRGRFRSAGLAALGLLAGFPVAVIIGTLTAVVARYYG
jgi:Predicted membrane protein (DUF2142)